MLIETVLVIFLVVSSYFIYLWSYDEKIMIVSGMCFFGAMFYLVFFLILPIGDYSDLLK
ncbi:hypothetical protein [Helicobacter sp. 13S00482-2]|uniref:hypothetical protein n=1 Tax=Helicobacter sp. 13S00482-2 TaxID=1476200 RepID=UPI0015DB29D6|nr:hypothetical protein [Helicobacter sp. 13S00482-2]